MGEPQRVSTRKLGLAAYIKMNGGELVEFRDNRFHFKTTTSLSEWEVKYMNSCCHTHDSELVELRKLLQRR